MRETESQSQIFAKELRKNLTAAEQKLWFDLKGKRLGGFKFRRQMPIGPYIADFACISAKLVIEVDGATHGTQRERKHDEKRTLFLNSKGWQVIRFTNEEIFKRRNDVLDHILKQCSPSAP